MRHLAWTSWKTAALLAVMTSGAVAQSAPMPASTPGGEATAPAADRPYLGVFIEGAADGGGVKLAEIVEGSPAAKAGLQAGDVIVALGDRTIGSEEELRDAITSMGVGAKTKITFLRDGEKRRTSARLAAAPAEMEGEEGEEGENEGSGDERNATIEFNQVTDASDFGGMVELAPMSDDNAGWMGVQLQANDEGEVSILAVVPGSPAEAVGLQAGDIFERFDTDEVDSVEGLVEQVREHQAGDVVKLRVRRGDKVLKPKLTLGKRDANLAVPGMSSGMASIELVPAATPAAPSANAGPTPPGRLHARIAAARGAAAAGNAAPSAESAEMQNTIRALKQQVDELRSRCEEQQRMLERVREALGGGSGGGGRREPQPDSMPMPAPMPGGSLSFAPGGEAGSLAIGGGDVSFTLSPLSSGTFAVDTARDTTEETVRALSESADQTVRAITLEGQNLTLQLQGANDGAALWTMDGDAVATIQGMASCTAGGDDCCASGESNADSCCASGESDDGSCCASGESKADSCCASDGSDSEACAATTCDEAGADGALMFTFSDATGNVTAGSAEGIALFGGDEGGRIRLVTTNGGDGGSWTTATPTKPAKAQKVKSVKGMKIEPAKEATWIVTEKAHQGRLLDDGRCEDCQAPCCQQPRGKMPAEFGRRPEAAPRGAAGRALPPMVAPRAPRAPRAAVASRAARAPRAAQAPRAPRLRVETREVEESESCACECPAMKAHGQGHGQGHGAAMPKLLRLHSIAPHHGKALLRLHTSQGDSEIESGEFELAFSPDSNDEVTQFEGMRLEVDGSEDGALFFEMPCEIECTLDGDDSECNVDCDEECEVQCEVQCAVDCDDSGK